MLRLLTDDEVRLLPREELEKYVAVVHRYVEITEIRRVHNLFKNDIKKMEQMKNWPLLQRRSY